jgi:hypothetical protein
VKKIELTYLYVHTVTNMEIVHNPQINEIVLIKRNDHNGDRIPSEYRMYIADKIYLYKARIVQILENKLYNRVQPLPLSADTTLARTYTRKGYKTKTYKLPV